ncbi:uncharacterized protein LOC125226456 [Leguminivora glycinivorella]|uniref:uncharacterized protein LOC125226456 n=1 Tax=Leguminivora glycinivorella TaxID=1035111 RepID=UPI00201003AD|nr:uncharacterized protein LOC125226456 [Leguminivora glycinivorella]
MSKPSSHAEDLYLSSSTEEDSSAPPPPPPKVDVIDKKKNPSRQHRRARARGQNVRPIPIRISHPPLRKICQHRHRYHRRLTRSKKEKIQAIDIVSKLEQEGQNSSCEAAARHCSGTIRCR